MAKTAVARTFLITASSEVVSSCQPRCRHQRRHHQQLLRKPSAERPTRTTGTGPHAFPVFTPLISFGSRKNYYLAPVFPSSRGASLSSWGPFSWAPLHVELEREAHTRGQ